MSKKFILPAILGLVLFLSISIARSDNQKCSHRIWLLPQTHRNVISPRLGEESIEEVSQSQFRIASFIQNHAAIPVFSEQVDTNLDSSSITGDLETLANQFKELFPKGMPKQYELLSIEQKKQLAFAGADGVLLLTGKISALHKVVPDRETQDELFARIKKLKAGLKATDKVSSDSEIFKLNNDVRERFALAEIQQFFESHPDIDLVSLVFGRLHNFQRHDDVFPSQCIETPSDF